MDIWLLNLIPIHLYCIYAKFKIFLEKKIFLKIQKLTLQLHDM